MQFNYKKKEDLVKSFIIHKHQELQQEVSGVEEKVKEATEKYVEMLELPTEETQEYAPYFESYLLNEKEIEKDFTSFKQDFEQIKDTITLSEKRNHLFIDEVEKEKKHFENNQEYAYDRMLHRKEKEFKKERQHLKKVILQKESKNVIEANKRGTKRVEMEVNDLKENKQVFQEKAKELYETFLISSTREERNQFKDLYEEHLLHQPHSLDFKDFKHKSVHVTKGWHDTYGKKSSELSISEQKEKLETFKEKTNDTVAIEEYAQYLDQYREKDVEKFGKVFEEALLSGKTDISYDTFKKEKLKEYVENGEMHKDQLDSYFPSKGSLSRDLSNEKEYKVEEKGMMVSLKQKFTKTKEEVKTVEQGEEKKLSIDEILEMAKERKTNKHLGAGMGKATEIDRFFDADMMDGVLDGNSSFDFDL